MKKVLLVTASLIALGATAPAFAADLAARPAYTKAPAMMAAVYDWSGFYIGANGGWGSSRNCFNNTANLGVATAGLSEGCGNSTGGTIGGQVGYRWQSGAFVFGVEGQGNWADFNGSNANLLVATNSNRSKIDAFGLLTGQVGYAFNNALLYVKGGAAVTSDRYNGFTTATGAVIDTASNSRWGGTVGVGLEYAFAPNWSAALEYDHLFMGTNNYLLTTATGANSRNVNVGQDVDLVTVRLNYRFGGPIVAKY